MPPLRADQLTTEVEVKAFLRTLVSATFVAETEDRQSARNRTELTMSGLGGCTRAGAYSLAGVPASDEPYYEEGRDANLGTWEHDGFLPRAAKVSGGQHEVPVVLRAAGVEIRGTLDVVIGPLVVDLKTVKEWRLKGLRKRVARDEGAYDEHQVQVMGYATARYQSGEPVEWVAYLYMDRSTGEEYVVVERFTNAHAMAVIARVERIKYFADRDPDTAPREMRGPGLSFACDRCPWLKRCWGPNAKPGTKGVQRQIAKNDAGVEFALQLYRAGADQESAAKRDTEFAKLILDRTTEGTYGKFKLRRGRPGSTLDQEQVRKDYEDQGRPLPVKATNGRLYVEPVPADEVAPLSSSDA